MCYILCETPSSESHFFPITASGKEKKPPWTSSDLFKATENPNCLLCSAQLLPFIICQLHSPKCPQKCLPLREQSTGGYWNTRDEKTWSLAPGVLQDETAAQISFPSCSGKLPGCLLHQVQGPAISSTPVRVFLTLVCDCFFVVHLP